MSKAKNPYLKVPDLPQRPNGNISSDGYLFKGVLFDNHCPIEETGTDHDWSFICKDCQKSHQQLAENIDAGDGREYECGVSGCSVTSTEVDFIEFNSKQATGEQK